MTVSLSDTDLASMWVSKRREETPAPDPATAIPSPSSRVQKNRKQFARCPSMSGSHLRRQRRGSRQSRPVGEVIWRTNKGGQMSQMRHPDKTIVFETKAEFDAFMKGFLWDRDECQADLVTHFMHGKWQVELLRI